MDARNPASTLPLSMRQLDSGSRPLSTERNCFYNLDRLAIVTGMATATLPMTREEIREEVKTIRKVSKKIMSSKESAKRFLVEFGVLTKNGKLTAKYR